MCFCESDVINLKIHFTTRKRYPGIKFHEDSLRRAAEELGVTDSEQFKVMSEPELQHVADTLLRHLPEAACPPIGHEATARDEAVA